MKTFRRAFLASILVSLLLSFWLMEALSPFRGRLRWVEFSVSGLRDVSAPVAPGSPVTLLKGIGLILGGVFLSIFAAMFFVRWWNRTGHALAILERAIERGDVAALKNSEVKRYGRSAGA